MTESSRSARPDHPIHEALVRRWSPSAFSSRSVPAGDLRSIFEAARWAPSSYNEQPWRYLVATRETPERYEQILKCLVDANQAWAKSAPVLAIGCVHLKFSRNGRPNGVALHDLGAASSYLTFEATARGLFVHQMAGILPDRVRLQFGVPEDYQPVTGLAIGYLADPQDVPADLRARDAAPRERNPLSTFVFEGGWGTPSCFV